jgi:hypothetical protein
MTDPFNIISSYIKISRNGWKILLHKQFQSIGLISDICNESIPAPEAEWESIVSSDTARVFRCRVEVDGKPVRLYIKEYLSRSIFDQVKHLFHFSRAMRSFSAGMMLQANHLHSPDIAAILEKRAGPAYNRNILITQEISNAHALYTFFEGDRPLESRAVLRDRREMLTELGKTIGRMHTAGIFHGDLRGGNLFVSKDGSDWRFYFIDNERTVKCRRLPLRLRIKNLVQLNMLRYTINNTARMRFFKAYVDAAGLDKDSAARLAAKVIERTGQRLRKRSLGRIGIPETTSQDHWDFQRIRHDDQSGIFLNEFCRGPEKAQFIQQVKSSMETGELLKDDISTRVVRCCSNGRNIVI